MANKKRGGGLKMSGRGSLKSKEQHSFGSGSKMGGGLLNPQGEQSGGSGSKMSGRGMLKPKEEFSKSSGSGYWKDYGQHSSSLLDNSERKKHISDIGQKAHDKKVLKKAKKGLGASRSGSLGGSFSARGV